MNDQYIDSILVKFIKSKDISQETLYYLCKTLNSFIVNQSNRKDFIKYSNWTQLMKILKSFKCLSFINNKLNQKNEIVSNKINNNKIDVSKNVYCKFISMMEFEILKLVKSFE